MDLECGLWSLLPQKARSKDQITGHKFALLVLIHEYCRVKTGRHRDCNQEPWEHTSKQCRDFAISSLKLLQSPDMSLAELLSCLQEIMHPCTLELFTTALKTVYDNGVAGIMDYVPNLESLLADTGGGPAVIHKSSVLGLFVRRMLLALDKLDFSGLMKLHRNFRSYHDATRVESTSNEESKAMATQRQADYFLAQQVALMQLNEKAALPPPQLQKRIRELQSGNPDLADAHYISFLNCLSVKEYFGATESLRYHFDRNVPEPATTKGACPEDNTKNQRYASLNLSILHFKVGQEREAMAALREAVTLAQEANDTVFLQHALSWLCVLQGTRCSDALLRCSVTRASELGLWGVASLGILALARLGAESGCPPAAALELLSRSDQLNCQHSIADAAATALAQRSAFWGLYGFHRMAHLQSQLLLQLGRADPLRAAGVQALGEATCLAIRNLACALATHGRYQDCSALLDKGKTMFPNYSASQVTLKTTVILCSFS